MLLIGLNQIQIHITNKVFKVIHLTNSLSIFQSKFKRYFNFMKQIFLTLFISFFLFSCNQVSKQRIETTQEWISAKIRQYSLEEPGASHNYNIRFENGIISIENTLTITSMDDGSATKIQSKYSFPLNMIETISFQEKEKASWLVFNMKNGAKEVKGNINGKELDPQSQKEIILSKAIEEDGMKNRLIEAFTLLVESSGGKLISDSY